MCWLILVVLIIECTFLQGEFSHCFFPYAIRGSVYRVLEILLRDIEEVY